MRQRLLIVLACILIAWAATAAGPSTRPTTSLNEQLARADAEVESAAERLARVSSRWEALHASAEQRAEARPDIARLNGEVAQARKKWEAALAQDRNNPQGGMQSSGSNPLKEATEAYAAALEAHQKAVQQAIAEDPGLQKATQERKKTREGLRRAKVTQLDIRSTLEAGEREISLAVREKSLAAGMTEAQAEQAMGGPGTVIAQTVEGKTLAWECTVVVENQLVTNGTYARIAAGKVVKVWGTVHQRYRRTRSAASHSCSVTVCPRHRGFGRTRASSAVGATVRLVACEKSCQCAAAGRVDGG